MLVQEINSDFVNNILRTKSGKFELVNYKPTPFLHIQAISFIFGKINCAENEEDLASIKVKTERFF